MTSNASICAAACDNIISVTYHSSRHRCVRGTYIIDIRRVRTDCVTARTENSKRPDVRPSVRLSVTEWLAANAKDHSPSSPASPLIHASAVHRTLTSLCPSDCTIFCWRRFATSFQEVCVHFNTGWRSKKWNILYVGLNICPVVVLSVNMPRLKLAENRHLGPHFVIIVQFCWLLIFCDALRVIHDVFNKMVASDDSSRFFSLRVDKGYGCAKMMSKLAGRN